MILILSEENDFSTSDTIEWILHMRGHFLRWNEKDSIVNLDIEFTGQSIKINLKNKELDKKIILDSISKFWYRRGDFYLSFFEKELPYSIEKHLLKEWKVVQFFLHNFFSEKDGIGNFFKESNFDKLMQLAYALEVGLNVPKTIISTSKNKLESYMDEKIVTKFLNAGYVGKFDENDLFAGGTNSVNTNHFKNLENNVFPTQIQEQIEKAYELRIFFFHDNFFPMAIFSQNNSKTKTDYRNYDVENPNRNVPYALPKKIELKLIALNKKLGMNTGSIDMIVTPEDQFIFLEVNHVGQFGWVSENCNFYLEKEIAKYLVNG